MPGTLFVTNHPEDVAGIIAQREGRGFLAREQLDQLHEYVASGGLAVAPKEILTQDFVLPNGASVEYADDCCDIEGYHAWAITVPEHIEKPCSGTDHVEYGRDAARPSDAEGVKP